MYHTKNSPNNSGNCMSGREKNILPDHYTTYEDGMTTIPTRHFMRLIQENTRMSVQLSIIQREVDKGYRRNNDMWNGEPKTAATVDCDTIKEILEDTWEGTI